MTTTTSKISFSQDEVVLSGEVVVADPQILFNPTLWKEFEDSLDEYEEQARDDYSEYKLAVTYQDTVFFVSRTAFGDSGYTYPVINLESDLPVGHFFVKSGMYCIMPAKLADQLLYSASDDTIARLDVGQNRPVAISGDGDSFIAGHKIATEGDENPKDEPGVPAWLDAFDHNLEQDPEINLGYDPNDERPD